MLVLGTIFRCLGPILTIVACLSSKPLFLGPLDKREEANRYVSFIPRVPSLTCGNRRARYSYATGNSDLLTDICVFDECMKLQAEGASKARKFCEAVRPVSFRHWIANADG